MSNNDKKHPSGRDCSFIDKFPQTMEWARSAQSGFHSFAMAMQEEVVILEWPIETKESCAAEH